MIISTAIISAERPSGRFV